MFIPNKYLRQYPYLSTPWDSPFIPHMMRTAVGGCMFVVANTVVMVTTAWWGSVTGTQPCMVLVYYWWLINHLVFVLIISELMISVTMKYKFLNTLQNEKFSNQ